MDILGKLVFYIVWISFCSIVLSVVSCSEKPKSGLGFTITDPDLTIELVAEAPEIQTPIGMAIDETDALYVLESHTHTPPKEYKGPKFDRIKKSIDQNGDGIPERWTVFADSIEDGMNLAYSAEYGLYLTTKNGVYRFIDEDGDGIAENRTAIVHMTEPENVYDHAGILGIAFGKDNWLYVSRGNSGGKLWRIIGSDKSQIEGFGDGGNVFRCKVNGSQIEEVATGFWNPFDLKFDTQGRLFATDNDPDSRGPNRLLEIVPGGDYGYKSVYGGSGIHPFSSWNGELPGTLPFSAPLGEAPCALIPGMQTHFGEDYASQLLVNVWEENNIVRVPLESKGSSVTGKPEVWIQGDTSFHPVALAANNKGDLYITDWVLREYPNHGQGRLWRVRSRKKELVRKSTLPKIDRFGKDNREIDELKDDLIGVDGFDKAIIRYHLAKKAGLSDVHTLVRHSDSQIRLEGLLLAFDIKGLLDVSDVIALVKDKNEDVQRTALMYIAEKGMVPMKPHLNEALKSNSISVGNFEAFLATIRHLQPDFRQGMAKRSGKSGRIPRELPKSFVADILRSPEITEEVKAMSLPYLEDYRANEDLIKTLLGKAKNPNFQIALIKATQSVPGVDYGEELKDIAFDPSFKESPRAMALQALSYGNRTLGQDVILLLKGGNELLQYIAVKYICGYPLEDPFRIQAKEWIDNHLDKMSPTALSVWERCTKEQGGLLEKEQYTSMVGNGNPELGRLVFENRTGLCTTCHSVNGWGGSFGPELSKIGHSKTRLQLVTAILDPSSEISPEWQGWYVVDANGTRHTGRQIDVHLNYTELMNTQGEYDSFKNPSSYGVMEVSLMPEGLYNTMTPLEFNDLIAYLSDLK
ncbi:MAG: PVC-type heme-binding CxxCH protein [Bacteroidota bacterium]